MPGLTQTGELLAVTNEIVTPRDGGTPWESKKLLIFDGRSAVEVAVGRDFPQDQYAKLLGAKDKRPLVTVEVFVFKGRLYAESLVDAKVPANA